MTDSKRKLFTITYDEDDIHFVIKQNPNAPATNTTTPRHCEKKPKLQAEEELELEDGDQHVNIKNLSLGDLLSTADFFHQQTTTSQTEEEIEELLFTRTAIVKQLCNIENVLNTILHCNTGAHTSLYKQTSMNQATVAGKVLPLADSDEFMELEINIANSNEMKEEFILYLRAMKPILDNSEEDTFRLLFSDNCLYNLSWQGTRTSVHDTCIFKELLHSEWYPELSDEDYVKSIKMFIDRARRRCWKTKQRQKREAELEEDYNRKLET